jgi:hypothetical protein
MASRSCQVSWESVCSFRCHYRKHAPLLWQLVALGASCVRVWTAAGQRGRLTSHFVWKYTDQLISVSVTQVASHCCYLLLLLCPPKTQHEVSYKFVVPLSVPPSHSYSLLIHSVCTFYHHFSPLPSSHSFTLSSLCIHRQKMLTTLHACVAPPSPVRAKKQTNKHARTLALIKQRTPYIEGCTFNCGFVWVWNLVSL